MRNAVVLAAGRGTRMGGLTADLPKPMIPLRRRPILEHVLDRLRAAGFTRVLIVTGFRADIIESHFHDYPLEIRFVRQDPIDGTGRAALLAKDFVGDEPFLLTFGDILADPEDYAGISQRLESEPSAAAAIGVKYCDDPWQGAAVYAMAGVVERIVEKPPQGTSTTRWNSAGVNAFRPVIFEELAGIERSPRGEFELTDGVSRLLQNGYRLLLYPLSGVWRDIGRPDDLPPAEQMVKEA